MARENEGFIVFVRLAARPGAGFRGGWQGEPSRGVIFHDGARTIGEPSVE